MLKKFQRGGIAASFIICFGFSAFAILAFSLIMTAVAMSTEDPASKIGIFALISMLTAAFVSGIFTSKFKGDGGLGFTALLSLMVVLIMLLINVIISGGRVSGSAFMNYGCYLGVFILSSLLGKSIGNRKRHKHH